MAAKELSQAEDKCLEPTTMHDTLLGYCSRVCELIPGARLIHAGPGGAEILCPSHEYVWLVGPAHGSFHIANRAVIQALRAALSKP